MKIRLTLALCFAVLLACSSAALAAPINGDIAFGRRIQFDTGDFNTASAITGWYNTHVEIADGDYASLPPNTPVAFSAPWVFNPSTPTSNFWSVGGFTFDLLTATILNQGGGFLNISGTGIISSTNSAFDPTVGTWFFSAQNPKVVGTFSFSSGSTSVPEADSTALAAVGGCFLLSCVVVRSRGRRQRISA